MFWGDIWSVVLRYGEQQELQPELKIDKTQTQVDLQFLSRSDQFKKADLAPQIQNCQKSKLSVPALLYLSKQLCHITHWAQQIPSWQSFPFFSKQLQNWLEVSQPPIVRSQQTDRGSLHRMSENCQIIAADFVNTFKGCIFSFLKTSILDSCWRKDVSRWFVGLTNLPPPR